MKQSESNLFSGGMNLDANPIAIDNKSLHSALNATMITMNGNELILQNDMGNVKVGTAKLPDGYVPIGMKEFGGIVYVAAYNPLKRTSLIGSFPSPLQQSASDSDSDSATIGGFTNDTVIDKYTLSVKVSTDKLRPGDKFYIVISEALLAAITSGCYTYDICILDSSNSLVPITDKLVIEDETQTNSANPGLYTTDATTNKYYYYKGNLVGYVYFKLSLNIPEFFQYSIIGREDNGNKYIDITLPKHDFITKYRIVCTQSKPESQGVDVVRKISERNPYPINVTGWDQTYTKKDLEYNETADIKTTNSATSSNTESSNTEGSNIEDSTTESSTTESSNKYITLDNIVTIKITPYFEETASTENETVVEGYLDKLTYTCTVNLNKLGSGQIDFSEFRYYTNVNEGTVLLNYSLMSYLNSTQVINSLELVATPWTEVKTTSKPIGDTSANGVTVTLSDGSYNLSGSFLKTIEDLDMNTIYVAVLKCTIGTVGDDSASTTKYGKPFVLITSEFVNDMYTSSDTEYIDGAETITIPQTITATYADDVCSITYDLGLTSYTVGANDDLPSNALIYNRAEYTIKTDVPSYTSTLNVAGTAFDGLFEATTVTPTVSPVEISDNRADYANLNNYPTRHTNIKGSETYTAYSEFITTEKPGDVSTLSLYGHLPYLGDATCEDVLLTPLIPVLDNGEEVGNASAVPQWFVASEWKTDHGRSSYRMFTGAESIDRRESDETKRWKGAEGTTLTGSTTDWTQIQKLINKFFEETRNTERPLILFTQAEPNVHYVKVANENATNFSIPMLMNSNGKYYFLDEYGFAYQPTGSTTKSEIDSLQELLNNVFVYQSTKPQTYACKIVTANKDSYYYDGDYTVTLKHTATIAETVLSYVNTVHPTIYFNADYGTVLYTSQTGSNIKTLSLPTCKTATTTITSELKVNISGLESFALLALSTDGNPSLGNGLFDGETWHFDKYYNPGEVYFKIGSGYYTADQVINMYYIKILGVYDLAYSSWTAGPAALYVSDGNGGYVEDTSELNKKLFFLACQFKDGLFEYKTSSEYNSIGGIYLGSKYAAHFAVVGGNIWPTVDATLVDRGMLITARFDSLTYNRLTYLP